MTLTALVELIKGKAKLIAIYLVIIGGVSAVVAYQYSALDKAKAAIVSITGDLNQAVKDNKSLQGTVDDQNKQIDRLNKLQHQYDEAEKDDNAKQAQLKASNDALKKQIADSFKADGCTDVIPVITKQLLSKSINDFNAGISGEGR